MGVKRVRKARNAKRNNYLYVYFLFVFGLVFCGFFAIRTNRSIKKLNDINVELIGSEFQTLSINSNYLDEGIKMTVNDEEIDINDVDYTINNNIDSSTIGTYQVTYEVKYDNDIYEVIRNVEVVDDVKPQIIVYNQTVGTDTCENEIKSNLNYYAFDNYDGIITDKVNVLLVGESYQVSVSDSSGNYNEVVIPINNENKAPIIEIKGTLIEYVPLNSIYSDKGAIAKSICGTELKENILVNSNVNTSIAGSYKVKYTIDGYDSYAERIVIVYEKRESDVVQNQKDKVIYLTFDDGPGKYTEELLDILKKYDVKATFFVTNQFSKYIHLIQREYNEGHVVGVHTLTHKWSIYRSLENYMKDFNDMNAIIESYTGKRSTIYRFPGGSSNTISKGQSTGIMKASISRMNELGYVYFDWNVDSEDAAGANSKKIYNNVISGIQKRNYSVVLMHDIKKNTIDVIEDIIIYGLENGYTFDVLSSESATVHHHANN